MTPRMSSWRDAALREMGLGPIWVRRGSQASAPLVPEASAPQQAAMVSQQAAVHPVEKNSYMYLQTNILQYSGIFSFNSFSAAFFVPMV